MWELIVSTLEAIRFIIARKPALGNKLSKEFKVKLTSEIIGKYAKSKELCQYSINYEIIVTSEEKLSINYIYLILPSDVTGNSLNKSITQVFPEDDVGDKGKFYIHFGNEEIQFTKKGDYNFDEDKVLRVFNYQKLKYFQIVVNTNKYGDVKSNKLKFDNK